MSRAAPSRGSIAWRPSPDSTMSRAASPAPARPTSRRGSRQRNRAVADQRRARRLVGPPRIVPLAQPRLPAQPERPALSDAAITIGVRWIASDSLAIKRVSLRRSPRFRSVTSMRPPCLGPASSHRQAEPAIEESRAKARQAQVGPVNRDVDYRSAAGRRCRSNHSNASPCMARSNLWPPGWKLQL